MANRITTAIDALAAAITTAGLKVKRAHFSVRPEPAAVVYLLPSRLSRDGCVWTLAVEISVACTAGESDVDQAVSTVLAALDAALDVAALNVACGGIVELPSWEYIYSARQGAGNLVGAAGLWSVRFEGPLTTA